MLYECNEHTGFHCDVRFLYFLTFELVCEQGEQVTGTQELKIA